MNKEKEIEEMANIMYNADIASKLLAFSLEIVNNAFDKSKDLNSELHKDKLLAEELIKVGYRKADEVRKETAKEIADFLKSIDFNLLPNVILEKYGVETDKCEITD